MKTGIKILFTIVLLLFFGIILILQGLKPGGILSNKILEALPTRNSNIPVNEWNTYKQENPKFSIKYPTDYSYKVGGAEKVNIAVVTFSPNVKQRALDGVVLRVMKKGDSTTLQDWLTKNATYKDRFDPNASNFLLVGVKNIEDIKVSGNDAVKFFQETTADQGGEGTLLMSDNYVFGLLHPKDKALENYQKMLESLTY